MLNKIAFLLSQTPMDNSLCFIPDFLLDSILLGIGASIIVLAIIIGMVDPSFYSRLFPNSKTTKLTKIDDFIDTLANSLDEIEDEEILPLLKKQTSFKLFEAQTEGELSVQWEEFKKSRKTKAFIHLEGEIISVKKRKLSKKDGIYTLEVIYKSAEVKPGKLAAYKDAVEKYLKLLNEFRAAKKFRKHFKKSDGKMDLRDLLGS